METKTNAIQSLCVGSLTIDTSSLSDALTLVERIKATAIEARAALDALGIAPAPKGEFVVGELASDETPGLILIELRGLRADLESMRQAGRVVTV